MDPDQPAHPLKWSLITGNNVFAFILAAKSNFINLKTHV
jgi:hypothetical protein